MGERQPTFIFRVSVTKQVFPLRVRDAKNHRTHNIRYREGTMTTASIMTKGMTQHLFGGRMAALNVGNSLQVVAVSSAMFVTLSAYDVFNTCRCCCTQVVGKDNIILAIFHRGVVGHIFLFFAFS